MRSPSTQSSTPIIVDKEGELQSTSGFKKKQVMKYDFTQRPTETPRVVPSTSLKKRRPKISSPLKERKTWTADEFNHLRA